jgi:hypothetical protein
MLFPVATVTMLEYVLLVAMGSSARAIRDGQVSG